MMKLDLPLSCSCAEVRGTALALRKGSCRRLLCFCRDCQAFAYHLERAPDVLDDSGGTDIVALTASQLRIETGGELLRCVRLAEGGLLRWYAHCCRTAIGNTLATSQSPHVGLIHTFMNLENLERETVLGPIRLVVFSRSARGDISEVDGVPRASPFSLVRMMFGLAAARLRQRHRPTPFFDAAGEPDCVPHVLTEEEHEHAYPWEQG